MKQQNKNTKFDANPWNPTVKVGKKIYYFEQLSNIPSQLPGENGLDTPRPQGQNQQLGSL